MVDAVQAACTNELEQRRRNNVRAAPNLGVDCALIETGDAQHQVGKSRSTAWRT